MRKLWSVFALALVSSCTIEKPEFPGFYAMGIRGQILNLWPEQAGLQV